jgi:hypothetical protein
MVRTDSTLACVAVFATVAAIRASSLVQDRLCFAWTRLRSIDRPSVVDARCSGSKSRCESESRIPNPLFRFSLRHVNKKQHGNRSFD